MLVACGPAGPGEVVVTASGSAGMNPGPDGSDRPLTVSVLQLRGTAAFNAADPFALQDPASALGADLISVTQIPLTPGATATKAVSLDPAVAAIGVVAGFRDPTGKQFRASAPISPTAKAAATVAVGPGGLTFSLS